MSEKNELSLNLTNTAWHKYVCFSVLMHWVFTEIISILQKLFSEKKELRFNSENAAWHITEIFLRNFVSALWQLKQKLLFISETSQKIDTPRQNYVATVIWIIERSHSTASLVHWNNFCCMMKVFCIENKKYRWW